MTRLLIVGGRSFNDPAMMCLFFSQILKTHKASEIQIAHCGAKGAGGMAARFAQAMRIPVTAFHPDFEHDGKGAMSACADRALNIFKPDMVISFPGGKGTAEIILSAQKRCRVCVFDGNEKNPENNLDALSSGAK